MDEQGAPGNYQLQGKNGSTEGADSITSSTQIHCLKVNWIKLSDPKLSDPLNLSRQVYSEGDETVEQVTDGGCGYLTPGSV